MSWQLCVNARQAREDYLKESSVLAEGLLAREEMTGYIIGDAVNLPVMPAKKAMAVGEKAYKEVGPKDCKMKKNVKRVKKEERARHNPTTDEERAAVEAAVMAAMLAPIDLGLPSAASCAGAVAAARRR